MRLDIPPLFERLSSCQRILLAGAGGGYDILAGLPLYECLRGLGKEVFLANLSFSSLRRARGRWIEIEQIPLVLEVLGDCGGVEEYFPERYLAEWLASRGQPAPVYAYKAAGVRVLESIFRHLAKLLDLDALVLVDGGCDILMRGNEPDLGTPHEDIASLAAAHCLDLPVRLLVCLGFGVDRYHGVCHAYVLESMAELTAQGAFLGGLSLLPSMPEFRAYLQALQYIFQRMPDNESIVNTSIAAAGLGRFGDDHVLDRTRGQTLFINPLMSTYFAFEVDGVARRCLYLDVLRETSTRRDVDLVIDEFRRTVPRRPWLPIPL